MGQKRSGRRLSGIPDAVFSRVGWMRLSKADGDIFSRSSLEADVFLALQYAADVASFERNDLKAAERAQLRLGRSPATNKIFTLADGREHTPDLRVVLTDGTICWVQVGPIAEKTATEMASRLEAVRVLAREECSEFVVLTERVRRGHRINNLGRIHKRRHLPLPDDASVARFDALCAAAHDLIVRRYPERLTVPSAVRALRADSGSDLDEAETEAAVFAAIAAAEEQSRLHCDLESVRFDLGTSFTIAGDAPAARRGWLAGYIQAQALEPLPLPVGSASASVVLPTAAARSAQDSADLVQRLAIVHDKERQPNDTWAAIGARHGVEEWMARHWWKIYRREGEAGLTGGRESKGIRAHPDIKAMIRRLMAKKIDASKIHRHVDMRRLLREKDLRVSYAQVVRYVRFLKQTDPLVVEQRLERPRLRASSYYGDPGWLREVVAPGQVVQVDAGIADALLQSSEAYAVLPRVQILWAIDVATRCILAWRVCLTTPTEVDYRKLIAMVMQPKDGLCRELGTELVLPAYCVPELILADRGWIFTAPGVRDDLLAMGIRPEHAAAYQPQMKPIIERLLQTINDLYIHWLPGTTLSGPDRREGRAVLKEALREGLTVDEFERALGLAVIDGYHDTPHGGLGKTPMEAWADATALYGVQRWPQTPAAELRLKMFQLKRVDGTRVLDPRGYHALDTWIKPMAAAPAVAQLLYDPDDVRFPLVCEGEGPGAGRFVCDAFTTGIDLSAPVTEGELDAIRNPRSKAAATYGEERLAALHDKIARGRKLKPKEAQLLERKRRGRGRQEPEARTKVPSETPIDLRLDAKPDYAAM